MKPTGRDFWAAAVRPQSPQALRARSDRPTGTVLDPIFSLRCRVTLEPRERAWNSSFVTLAASVARSAAGAGRQVPAAGSRQRGLRNGVDARAAGVPLSGHRPGRGASLPGTGQPSALSESALRVAGDRLHRNRLGQSGALGARNLRRSADGDGHCRRRARHLPLVRELLLAHTYWRLRGFRADLIILNQESPSYDRPLHQQLQRQIEAHSPATASTARRRFPARLASPFPKRIAI